MGGLPSISAFRDDAGVVHDDRSVRALLGAHFAADAPVLDHYFAVAAAMDRPDRATDHAHGIETRPARCRDQVLSKARTVQEQPAAAVVVAIDASLDAFVAARAAVQVDEHEPLALDQA